MQTTKYFVQELIKNILLNEDPKQPYSDADIVKQLLTHDVHIARRTVTKYREYLGFGSSSERKIN